MSISQVQEKTNWNSSFWQEFDNSNVLSENKILQEFYDRQQVLSAVVLYIPAVFKIHTSITPCYFIFRQLTASCNYWIDTRVFNRLSRYGALFFLSFFL